MTFTKSKLFLVAIAVLAELIILLGVFRLGTLVGFRKANFSDRWGQHYHEMFGSRRPPGPREFLRDDYVSGSGVVGEVLSVASGTLMVKGKDNIEKSVTINAMTTIQKNRETIQPADIKPADQIMVIGSPSTTGQIEAKFIRIFKAR